MPAALVLCLSDPARDPRPRRVVETLRRAGSSVAILSHELSGGLACDRHYPLPVARRRFGRLGTLSGMLAGRASDDFHRAIAHRFNHAAARVALAGGSWDLIVVEDIYLLPLAFEVRGSARIVVDAREYYPRIAEHSLRFRLLQKPELVWLCRTYLPRCDAVVTVSDGLAAAFADDFGVRATVVRSAPELQHWPVRPPQNGRIRLVHHGIANRNRRIEEMIAICAALDERFSLDLYLTGDPSYIAELRERAAQSDRARVHPPVPYAQIGAMLNEHDIGFFYVEPTTFNLRHCLPNKFFEFVQARLAVAIGPSPDMAALVARGGFGVVARTFTRAAMVDALSALTPDDVLAMKQRSDFAARELCFEAERPTLAEALGCADA